MDRTTQQWQIPVGTDVVGADGDKVGKVVAAEPSYIVVEKGFFFPTDYYIPTSAINTFDGDRVSLNVTKDEALNQGWDQPVGGVASGTGASYVSGAAGSTAEGDRLAGVTPTGLAGNVDVGTADRQVQTGSTEMREGETLRMPVYEEELTATKRPVQEGQVRITKDVVAEERTLDVPVTEERVRVERRAVDRDAGANAAAFKEETIEVPVRGEEVDVQKRVRVAEEVDVDKEAVQRTERVAGTVRREEVHVDDSTATTRDATDAPS